jgi:hypothetical protein
MVAKTSWWIDNNAVVVVLVGKKEKPTWFDLILVE